jgi:hypothetical protein
MYMCPFTTVYDYTLIIITYRANNIYVCTHIAQISFKGQT